MNKTNKKHQKNRLFACIFVLTAVFLSGCGLNVSPNVGGYGNANMTPRLITIAEGQQTSQVVQNVQSAIVGIKSSLGTEYAVGSGVAIKQGGYILTNQHVVANTQGITIYFADKSSASASLIWQDSSIDLAVIKSSKDMPYLECETENIAVGQDVIAIGTPLSLAFGHTVTKGIVSALDRTLEVQNKDGTISYMQNLIQHDASINPGNSGGPLINANGKVIGINTLKATNAEGIGFAIPIVSGQKIVSRLSTDAGYTAPYMGIIGISTDYARSKNLAVNNNGLYVLDVDRNSVAGMLGLLKGDVIYQIDNTKINTFLDLRNVLYSHSIGDKIEIYLYRDNTPMQLSMTLGERMNNEWWFCLMAKNYKLWIINYELRSIQNLNTQKQCLKFSSPAKERCHAYA